MSTWWMDCKNIKKKKNSRWLFEIIHIIRFEIWDLRSRDLKIFLGYDINSLSIWPFMGHPWFPTRKALKLRFTCFQLAWWWPCDCFHLAGWCHSPASWKQTNISFGVLENKTCYKTGRVRTRNFTVLGVCLGLLSEILAVLSTHMHFQMAPLDNCSENVLQKIWCKMHPYYDNKRMYLIWSPVFLVINNYINSHCQQLKPSISSHSKPHTMARARLLKCFVLQPSVIKTKHLRRLVQGFEWLEILGLRP